MRLAFLLVAFGVAATAGRAGAQDAPRPRVQIALLQTSAEDAQLQELAAALDQVLAAEIERNGRAQVSERPALDLPATQLAVDCVSETAECLRSVTDQLHVEGLLAAVLRRAGSETVVMLLYFDAQGVGAMKGVTRKHSGEDVEQHLLDAIPAMVDEAIGAPTSAAAASGAASSEPAAAHDTAAAAAGVPVGPIVLGAGGLVLIGLGSAFGLAANAAEDDYAALEPKKPGDAKALQDKLDSAQTKALLSNLGLGLGAAALTGSVIWWLLSDDDPASGETALAPILSPRQIGLTLRTSGSL